jgi:UDP-glucose 4-epimerase
MKRVLVTGATGFIGSALCEQLARSDYCVRAALRSARPVAAGISETAVVGDIGDAIDWAGALKGVDAIIHLAALAHLSSRHATTGAYMEINAHGTRRLASAAAAAGVRRFIYLSSVKVNGEKTKDSAFGPDDEPHPEDAYGMSKWLAEQHLAQVAAKSDMQAVIVRSPLVYGPGVRANFLRLLRWVDSGWPMPLAAIDNRRSLVSVWNLCDLLVTLMRNPGASGGTWMVSDADDLSTPQLVHGIARAMNRRARLISVPVGLLQACGWLTGRQAEVRRLCESLVVDASRTRALLGWVAPVSAQQALARTVAWYRTLGQTHGT